jgi:glycosyltransferase involved in cell wall biosynthesis
VTDVFLPRLGGIETHVDDLVRHQRAQGFDAQVLTPTAGAGNDPTWVNRLPVTQARRAITDYDVVHVHISMLSPYGVAVARAAAGAGIPTLVTAHSMWTGAGVVLRLAALVGLRRWPVTWSAVSGPAAAVFQRSIGRIEVAVLPNAIDIASWRHPLASTASADVPDGDGRDQTTVVSVMRLMPRKRPIQLLRMFEQARRLAPDQDLRMIVVGDGPLRRRMDRYVCRRGLDPHVRITGRLPRPEVLQELRSAAMYVAPAPKESFGIAALEARCAGLPIIAHRRSGVTEFVRDRVEGILIDDDAEMAVAIADLACDQNLRARITAHNQRVAPQFDWTDILERTNALYRSAAERASTVAARTGSALEPLAVGA